MMDGHEISPEMIESMLEGGGWLDKGGDEMQYQSLPQETVIILSQ